MILTRPTITYMLDGTTLTAAVTSSYDVQMYVKSDADADWTDAGLVTGPSDADELVIADLDASRVYAALGVARSDSLAAISAPTAAKIFRPVATETEVTATGAFGKAAAALRDMIAASSTFQNDIGAVGTDEEKQAQAKQYIHIALYDPDTEFERPFVLISPTDSDRSELYAEAAYAGSGQLKVEFERSIPTAYQAAEQTANAELDFHNFVDGVIDDCQKLSSEPGYLLTREWNRIMQPARYAHDIEAYLTAFHVLWGLTD
ncbi:hypothetical protein STSP2_03165 [Anaerohalosphaera lusitana]|uniref:Uncharacterized protein n=1 Tax=Anaerohalosphaera lusitana TaxID=1936003 RepID=A0A1U9NQ70_9BACT|nr:hypothetical protein [Anaerohalosphaera lusitana]AQT69965.1 hypothetical protein STSP2_03165 [Anaerohalosphaera lusitana]